MHTTRTEIIARALIQRDGNLLLARQKTKSWSFLPGGHVEPGEAVELALTREIREELGVDAKILRIAGVVEHRYVEDDAVHHEINLVFEVDIGSAEPVSQEEHLEFRWLHFSQLNDTDVRPTPLKRALVGGGGSTIPFWQGLSK